MSPARQTHMHRNVRGVDEGEWVRRKSCCHSGTAGSIAWRHGSYWRSKRARAANLNAHLGCLSRSLGRARCAHNGRRVMCRHGYWTVSVARCAWWLLDWGAIAASVSSKWSSIGYSESRMDTRSARSPKPGLSQHTHGCQTQCLTAARGGILFGLNPLWRWRRRCYKRSLSLTSRWRPAPFGSSLGNSTRWGCIQ
jgi:hypothetical protein